MNMDNAQRAVASFKKELNCSQAIISTYGPPLGLERNMALKVAAAFGGGMGHLGHTCGAITGALMVIGLHCSKPGRSVEQVKEESYVLARELFQKFEARHGSTECKALIGQDIDTPEGMKAARQKGIFDTLCGDFVRSASEILEELLH
jgi:C_GCAxxG_C_C family probable redox protein